MWRSFEWHKLWSPSGHLIRTRGKGPRPAPTWSVVPSGQWPGQVHRYVMTYGNHGNPYDAPLQVCLAFVVLSLLLLRR